MFNYYGYEERINNFITLEQHEKTWWIFPITGLDDCCQVYIMSKKKEIETNKK